MFACAQAYVRFLRVLVWVHVLVLVGTCVARVRKARSCTNPVCAHIANTCARAYADKCAVLEYHRQWCTA